MNKFERKNFEYSESGWARPVVKVAQSSKSPQVSQVEILNPFETILKF